MDTFRDYLQAELMRRMNKNPHYSLRAFAQMLGFHHATLSTLISGKRKITRKTVLKVSKALALSPEETDALLGNTRRSHLEAPVNQDPQRTRPYFVVQGDAFSLISDWYFDAILELSLINGFDLGAKNIAKALGISQMQAKLAIETLLRLDLLKKQKDGRLIVRHTQSTNILDSDFTTAAQKKHQRAILEKSLQSLETVDRKDRDHTSTTMAIQAGDLPQVKELIRKFRRDLNAFLQREASEPDEVYQLQVSFFPLTQNKTHRSKK